VATVSTPSPELLVTFLESVGRRQDAELYLRLFKQHAKESFAVIAAEPEIYAQAAGAVVEPLHFLRELGLNVVLALGLLGESDPQAADLHQQLTQGGLNGQWIDLNHEHAHEDARHALRVGKTVVIDVRCPPPKTAEQRTAALSHLIRHLGTRKLVVLRSRGGLGPHRAGLLQLSNKHALRTRENGISVVNLTTDLSALTQTEELQAGEAELLERIRRIHEARPSLMTNITSPFNLLQELFTVKGAGTLVKTGARIDRYPGYDNLDIERLRKLLETTFDRPLNGDFTRMLPLHIYLEQGYRGVAITQPGLGATFLTKFAVNREAQGEGMGRDLWEAMLRDSDALYWRSRPENPIAGWYMLQCEGMQRAENWNVYWRGIPTARIGEIVEDAIGRPTDFVETGAAAAPAKS
jgi:hypothetical protein